MLSTCRFCGSTKECSWIRCLPSHLLKRENILASWDDHTGVKSWLWVCMVVPGTATTICSLYTEHQIKGFDERPHQPCWGAWVLFCRLWEPGKDSKYRNDMVRFAFHLACSVPQLSVPKADVKEGNVWKSSKILSLKTDPRESSDLHKSW